MKKIISNILKTLPGLIILYLVLLIPDAEEPQLLQASARPFLWNQDQIWESLEREFVESRSLETSALDLKMDSLEAQAEKYYNDLSTVNFQPADTILIQLLYNFFSTASLAAAGQQSEWLTDYYNKCRTLLKQRSQNWDINDERARNTLYRVLYGMRAAVEEVLLQVNPDSFSPVMHVKDEFSQTPSTDILGIKVHSGDLLVSRGGAEVSALISRGNDYPGNFSHVALIYIDDQTKIPYLIEAHIEKGVAIASVETYLKDKKLRFMVLRPRSDLPQLQKDPMLPQKAAQFAFDEANSRHIPYDFKMDFYDSQQMFCSEVGSYSYKVNGLQLWQAVSTISSPGVVNWLNTFGVENFVTQMPSDLEYDPQLAVVAEWRDTETLQKDHIDNAVMDAMLEIANRGLEIEFSVWQLPFVRLLKFYNMILNVFGKHGAIPEGLSATRALKSDNFMSAYNTIRYETEKRVVEFTEKEGYRPPYWKMVDLAEKARDRYYNSWN